MLQVKKEMVPPSGDKKGHEGGDASLYILGVFFHNENSLVTRNKYKLGRAPRAPSTWLCPQKVLSKNWVDGWINGWTEYI